MVVTKISPSYLYTEYNDDADLQGFVDAQNVLAQDYLSWFVNAGLPVYTGLSGSLLDWVAAGLYGLYRPVVPTSPDQFIGPYNTFAFNTLPFDGHKHIELPGHDLASDDMFKRYMTWQLYRGDGKAISTRWLKRRVVRFLTGVNGGAPNIDQTYGVSVSYSGAAVTVAIFPQYNALATAVFASLVAQGLLSLPFQNTFTVTT